MTPLREGALPVCLALHLYCGCLASPYRCRWRGATPIPLGWITTRSPVVSPNSPAWELHLCSRSRSRWRGPPDVSDSGVDCEALVVVCVPNVVSIARAAEILARSGAFGLVVLDLGVQAQIPTPIQARLLQAAQRHDMVVLCLTDTHRHLPSLGSLVSVRIEASRQPSADGQYRCEGIARKDKRYGPGWRYGAAYTPPLGLC